MDAPQGRYRVIEKDGRLVVIDNRTGAPASSPVVPPPPRMAGRGGPVQSASPVTAAKGGLDTLIDMALRLAVTEWDSEGRAVVRWEWKQNGREQRWDAALDTEQQRRLGLALIYAALLPGLFLLLAVLLGSWAWLGL